MKRVKKPEDMNHPQILEFARHAVWVAKLEETVEFLEDMCHDMVGEMFGDDVEPPDDVWDDEPFCVACSVVRETWEDESRDLERRTIAWLANDPEHWGIFYLTVIQPWQIKAGTWRRGLPRWVRALCTETMLAHYQHDRYGRQRMIDFDALQE